MGAPKRNDDSIAGQLVSLRDQQARLDEGRSRDEAAHMARLRAAMHRAADRHVRDAVIDLLEQATALAAMGSGDPIDRREALSAAQGAVHRAANAALDGHEGADDDLSDRERALARSIRDMLRATGRAS